MGVLEKIDAARGATRKAWSQPLSWAYDDFRLPFLSSYSLFSDRETIENDFEGYVRGAYKSNGIIFACVAARQGVFSQARFKWRDYDNGEPGKPYGNQDLRLLEKPWANGTTGDLLSLAEVDVSLAGNFWATTVDDRGRMGNAATGPGRRVARMRPDWVTQVIGSFSGDPLALDAKVVGILYHPRRSSVSGFGVVEDSNTVLLLPDEVCHYAPYPDPEARFRGMSWMTPIIREVQADKAATQHKLKFFEQGAPQPLDAGVLTPRGWSTMGAMVIGSEVIGSDGKPHRVTGVFPQGERNIYRVTFADGSTVECTEDHLWSVQSYYDRRRGVLRTMPLRDIVAGGLQYRSGPSKWAVPFVDPVEFDDPGHLPVDPYLLGLLLGDGCFRSNGRGSGGVSLAADLRDAEWLEKTLPDLVPAGVTLSRRDRGGGSEFYFRGPGAPRPNPMTGAMRALGLWDILGPDKFVPEPYLRGSVSQRVALLRGLLDSDGTVQESQPNSVSFTNKSRALADGVRELARSLGGTATIVEVPAKGQWLTRVQRLPGWITPFALPRKVATYVPPAERGTRQRFITDVELVGRKQAQCISVDTPDSLYVTDDYVLTHNTPNMVFKFDRDVKPEDFKKFKDRFNSEHQGTWNAYKALFLAGGADVEVVGADLKQLEFSATQGRGETRIAVAARIPAVILGISEGLGGSALNSGNYGQAKRNWAEGALQDMWNKSAASFQNLLPDPGDATELCADTRNIPFLREDAKDIAEIQQKNAVTLRQLCDAGFEPDAAIEYLMSDDLGALKGKHSGLFSVQLQPPGSEQSVEVTDMAKAVELLAAGWKVVKTNVPRKELTE